MLMRYENPTSPIVTAQKLRFGVPQDFWMFVAAVSQGRVAAHEEVCSMGLPSPPAEAGGYYTQPVQNVL